MSTMPKVSVVTTTYNDMDNLCRILEEVRKQTYKNIEHIIVDGGSTDGTVEILTRLSEEQPELSAGSQNRTMASMMPSTRG